MRKQYPVRLLIGDQCKSNGHSWLIKVADKRLIGHEVRRSAAVRADRRPHAGPTNLELCILKSLSPCGLSMMLVVIFDNFKA
jgi:hypothetical protein